jgi:hypothetical protein
MPFRPCIALLTRMKDPEGRTLFFAIRSTSHGRSNADFIRPHGVPDFEGDSAWFEIVKAHFPESPWPQWRVVRPLERGREKMTTTPTFSVQIPDFR